MQAAWGCSSSCVQVNLIIPVYLPVIDTPSPAIIRVSLAHIEAGCPELRLARVLAIWDTVVAGDNQKLIVRPDGVSEYRTIWIMPKLYGEEVSS